MAKKRTPIVTETTEFEKQEEFKEVVTGIVAGCEKLNVRKAASKDSEILAVIDAGTKVIIDGEEENFYKLDNGYVMKDFITIS